MRIGNEYKQLCTMIEAASKEGIYSITVYQLNDKNKKSLIDLGYEVTFKDCGNGNTYTIISWE